jgi:hypothetical protein
MLVECNVLRSNGAREALGERFGGLNTRTGREF